MFPNNSIKANCLYFCRAFASLYCGFRGRAHGRGSGGQSPPEAGDFLQIRFILSLFKDTNLVKIHLCGFYQIMNSSVRNYLIDIDQENCKYFAINITMKAI